MRAHSKRCASSGRANAVTPLQQARKVPMHARAFQMSHPSGRANAVTPLQQARCARTLDDWCTKCPSHPSGSPLHALKYFPTTIFTKDGTRVYFWGCLPSNASLAREDETYCGENSLLPPGRWKTIEQRELSLRSRQPVCSGVDFDNAMVRRVATSYTSRRRPARGAYMFTNVTGVSLNTSELEPVPFNLPTIDSAWPSKVIFPPTAVGLYARNCEEVSRFVRYCIGCEAGVRGGWVSLVALVDAPLAACSREVRDVVLARQMEDFVPKISRSATFNFQRTRALFGLMVRKKLSTSTE